MKPFILCALLFIASPAYSDQREEGASGADIAMQGTTALHSARPRQSEGVDSRLLNPAVRPDTLATTVCKPGWTRTIRPSRSLIDRYERRYLPPGADPRATVVDHIIPLSIGGNPRPPNLQIQTVAEAKRKDVEERRLHRAVCSGRLSLKDAQRRMGAWR